MSDFKNGLIKYEWRKKLPININKLKNIKGLEWQGENLNNKTILILSRTGYWRHHSIFKIYLLNRKRIFC